MEQAGGKSVVAQRARNACDNLLRSNDQQCSFQFHSSILTSLSGFGSLSFSLLNLLEQAQQQRGG